MQAAEWDHRLAVRANGRNLIGHAGVVLLRKVADRVGLAIALSAALRKGAGPGRRGRGMALVQPVCAIVLGVTNVLEGGQLQYHWRPVFPGPVSGGTLRRALAAIDAPVAARVERDRAAIRRVVWMLLALRPGGFLDRGVRPGTDRLVRPRLGRDRSLLGRAGLRRIRLLSRPGARCRDCSRSVSPDRSPNPPYRSLGNGLSTVSAVRQWQAKGLGSCCPGRCSG